MKKSQKIRGEEELDERNLKEKMMVLLMQMMQVLNLNAT